MLFPIASWLGAFLLFLVQPLIAKQILPWFGGAASVWTTCLLFFQVALVAGYLYAHVTRRLGGRRQRLLHAALLFASLAFLPIVLPEGLQPAEHNDPAGRLLLILLVSIGVPYALLAATAPLLQDWYAATADVVQPYRLYAYSNVGSLMALVSYPFLIEPMFGTRAQALLWSAMYGCFLVVCTACAWQAGRGAVPTRAAATTPFPPVDALLAALLSACGSGLLLSVTNRICQDVAAVPLLWVLPLALYLLTFVMAFAGFYHRQIWVAVFTVCAVFAIWALVAGPSMWIALQVAALAILLFAGCMICHGEMVALRPPPERLTAFYLMLSVGGAAGGLFVAVGAPLLFSSYVELALFTCLTPALLFTAVARRRLAEHGGPLPGVYVAGPAALLAVAVTAVMVGDAGPRNTIAAVRSFYGTLYVVEDPYGTSDRRRRLYHGRIMHGSQSLDPARRGQATSYYAAGTGVHLAIERHPRRAAGQGMQIATIGLGVGATAAWTIRADRMTFYELDPHVATFARSHFTFLRDAAGPVEVVIGDGRLSLEREVRSGRSHARFDVLAVDAFSGDSVPVHLLTREAFTLYRRVLAPGGIVAVHVSNLHLNLEPVVRGLAEDAGLSSVFIRSHSAQEGPSEWVLVGDHQFITRLRTSATDPVGPPLIWTDQYSSLLTILR